MNALIARKRLLVAQADLHRELIALERLQLSSRWSPARLLDQRHRWWVLGAIAVGGLLLARSGGKLLRWVPTLLAMRRLVKF